MVGKQCYVNVGTHYTPVGQHKVTGDPTFTHQRHNISDMQEQRESTKVPYTEINIAYGEAETIMKRLQHANKLDQSSETSSSPPSIFQKAIELEYPRLELAWKRCMEFEAGSASRAEVHISSLALIETKPSSPSLAAASVPETVTIHDMEDLHNEVKVCLIQLAEERSAGAKS